MLKKATLATAIGALVAFAIPAVASADAWTLNGEPVGTSTAKGVTVDGTGSLSATMTIPGGIKLELGSCEVHYHGTVWNEVVEEELVGHGEINDFEITTGGTCKVWVLNGPNGTTGTLLCNMSASTNTESPWTIKTSGALVAVEGANFANFFNAGCALGPGISASGTATGVFSGESISVNGSTDDMTTSTGLSVDLDGSVSLTPTEEASLTLE